MTYQFLDKTFLSAMNDIGRLGFEKYRDQSFHALRTAATGRSPNDPRTARKAICRHIQEHVAAYEDGTPHDVFQTLGHQMAAVAFNAMMEFYFAHLEE